MHVEDLASFKIVMVEMHHGILGLGNSWQECILRDFLILSMSLNFVFLLLFMFFFHLLYSSFSEGSQGWFITIAVEIRVTVFIIIIICLAVNLVSSHSISLLVLHFLFDLDFLVLHGFLYDHFLK